MKITNFVAKEMLPQLFGAISFVFLVVLFSVLFFWFGISVLVSLGLLGIWVGFSLFKKNDDVKVEWGSDSVKSKSKKIFR